MVSENCVNDYVQIDKKANDIHNFRHCGKKMAPMLINVKGLP